jgi:putative pyruvate formate lyase activating enzyme
MTNKEPGYLSLYHSGELQRRADILTQRLSSCDICPHRCGIDRTAAETGFCRSGEKPVISSFCAHHGEEPALSGTKGSGTIFFGSCNMRCIYCQNYQISQNPDMQKHNEVENDRLAEIMLHLQNDLKCHNINFVSPTHFVPQIVSALVKAVPQGLNIPLVYNTGGYDTLDVIRLLDGIIDIYLPDIRYSSNSAAEKYSGIKNYVRHNRAAVKEMYRQTGDLKSDENEIAYRGVIVRHLILPEGVAGSEDSLRWLAEEVSRTITISVMSQYYPCFKALDTPELSRTITYGEYKKVVDIMEKLGLENGWLQEMDAPANYLPDFDRDGHPFQR